ncbi:hypothetical protein D3H65_07995 [Paraflavitalea soli]|uniref:Uncharacterized protein n=1 Tax=Paraflavitalea soli TaxID=2315862 RepID=A0A3B7MQP7_9BACT|nr:hypothetical protein [Paraflavitalea soli]AXY73925.1 hypothetical protein D3H65_07995 [Paraflavitalea soli]
MKNYSARASELRLLIYKYAKGQLTMHEKQQLDAFMNRSPENADLVHLLTSPEGPSLLLERQARFDKVWKGHSFQTILNKYHRKRRRIQMRWTIITTLVVLLVAVMACYVVYLKGK